MTQIKERAAEYGRFPRLNAPATLLNIAALQLPFLLVPFFFGMEAAGSYFLAYRVLILPTALVGSAVGSVFFSKAAATEKEGAGTDVITGRVALGLIAVYLPIYLALALAGGPVFSFVFGGKWTGAGIYGRILTPAAFSTAIASPLSTVLVVKNRLGKSLTITMSDLLARGVALAVGVHFASLWLTVVLISTFSTVLGCVSLGLFLRWADVRVAPLAKAVGSIVWLNLPLLVVVGLAGIFAPPLLATISAGVMVVISCWLSSAFMKGLATA